MTLPCGCCTGVAIATPADTSNLPGLNALVYRIGTYTSFFETMKARLSSPDFRTASGDAPLLALKTRDEDDPAIALLDAWAVVADVLTFYQERIANEGYLRTATERQSVLQLAALVGHALRPGIASSTFLAYTIDPSGDGSTVSGGAKAKTIPGPGELPQTFETSQDLNASAASSDLAPRMTQPQIFSPATTQVYVSGVANNLNPNDPVLLIASPPALAYIATVDVQSSDNRTLITLQPSSSVTPPPSGAVAAESSVTAQSQTIPAEAQPAAVSPPLPVRATENLLTPLLLPPAPHPANASQLVRTPADVFKLELDTTTKMLQAFHPELGALLYTALANAAVTPPATAQLHAFRTKAAVFGNNAPLKSITDSTGIVIGTEEWPLNGSLSITLVISATAGGDAGRQLEANLLQKLHSGGLTVFAKVVQGDVSASDSAPVAHSTLKVGKWDLEINLQTGKQHEVDLKFPQLDRSYSFNLANDGTLTVKVDDGENILVPSGQKATAGSSDRHLLVSFGAAIVLSDDAALAAGDSSANVINLDAPYDKIVPGSWALIVRADTGKTLTTTVAAVAQRSIAAYGLTTRVTQLTLKDPWLDPKNDLMLSVARNTTVFTQSEQLALAEEPITANIAGDQIELGDLRPDLQPGQWVIVQGERSDVPGVNAAELMMLSGVKQGVQQVPVTTPSSSSSGSNSSSTSSSGAPPAMQNRPGDTIHTFLQLSNPLAYTYSRESVSIYGNVVPATHGETKNEVLGSGDSAVSFQQFSLRQSPLTYVSAPTAQGTASTLQVSVNGVQWNEVDSLSSAGPSDRSFVTRTDNNDKVTLTFGDGRHGMRLPTGAENVQATYHVGIGSAGNADPGKISMLGTKPLGARAVVNPLPASGGADRDSLETSRSNTPTAAIALDRLVSVQDYADFAVAFGGIGKASASQLSDGRRRVVFVTIAGVEGAAIDPSSALLDNLSQSFRQFGDPHLPVGVAVCKSLFLLIGAKVKVLPDYQWTSVEPAVEAALLARFSFDRQQFGQPVYLSSLIAAIQQVPGVSYVNVDAFDSIGSDDVASALALSAKFAELAAGRVPPRQIDVKLAHLDTNTGSLVPAELAFLNPDVPGTLLLTEIPS